MRTPEHRVGRLYGLQQEAFSIARRSWATGHCCRGIVKNIARSEYGEDHFKTLWTGVIAMALNDSSDKAANISND